MKPVHGIASYKDGIVKINGTPYRIADLRPDPRVAEPAYSLTKEDGTVYHVAVDEWGPRCDCADTTYRKRHCKHIRALQVIGFLAEGVAHGT